MKDSFEWLLLFCPLPLTFSNLQKKRCWDQNKKPRFLPAHIFFYPARHNQHKTRYQNFSNTSWVLKNLLPICLTSPISVSNCWWLYCFSFIKKGKANEMRLRKNIMETMKIIPILSLRVKIK